MSSLRPKWNHRARLTALLTITVSAALALVFFFVVLTVRQQDLNRRFADLTNEVQAVASQYTGPSSIDPDDFPGGHLAVYDSQKHLLATTSKITPAPIVGRDRSNDILTVGLFSKG